jgi:ZIP family zinc transporter
MGEAAAFGAVASSALVIGAVLGLRVQLPERLLAALLAFASGALITALAFELFEDSYEQGGMSPAGSGNARRRGCLCRAQRRAGSVGCDRASR